MSLKSLVPLIFALLPYFLPLAVAKTSGLHRSSVNIDRNLPAGADGRRTYIVHVGAPPAASPSTSNRTRRESWYASFLPPSAAGSGGPRLVYSYGSIVDGFAARLTGEELAEVEKRPGFVLAYPDRILQLETTHSPGFLGLRREAPGLWNDSNFGKGVIIGVLDTGISPDHPSFSGEGIPSPPAKWKGACEFSPPSICNNKLIGARTFLRGSGTNAASLGPYDDEGHGTHTAGTAAGAFVANANVDGQANGTAAGIAPMAHLAIYKVCSEVGCTYSDILAGMDAAVADGVDIISMSLSGGSQSFYNDGIAIGTFGAMAKGVLVSAAAGNTGPSYFSVANEAPWLLTVGAGAVDRAIRTTVKLGNGAEFNGESAYQPKGTNATMLPLAMGLMDIFCNNASFDAGPINVVDVRGKVVVCEDGNLGWIEKGENVKSAGGAAMIITNLDFEGVTVTALPHVLPASHVGYWDGLQIKSYVGSNQSSAPTAMIAFDGTVLGTSPAPVVAYFSSRGPGVVDQTILKPDVIGPGVNILAASPFVVGSDPPTRFDIKSGTSMATPHLSGAAALLKGIHPDWSPAAIKSAIMTTAYTEGNDGRPIPDAGQKPADVFAVGAGHVDPTKAGNPGIVYDMGPDDYVAHLCGLGYNNKQVNAIARRPKINCKSVRKRLGSELNYPSFMVILSAANFYNATAYRTVTNVAAPAPSAYDVRVTHPEGVEVRVKPKRIAFSKANQKAQFSVTFTSRGLTGKGSTLRQGSLTWVSSDKSITAHSPIAVMLN